MTSNWSKERWINAVGTYMYMSYILANFDPIRAREIKKKASHEEITDAFLSRKFYNKIEDG